MTPDHLHATILIAARKQRRHVIVQKPIADRLQEAKLVFDVPRQTKVATYFMPYGCTRLDLARGWIKDGAIGSSRCHKIRRFD